MFEIVERPIARGMNREIQNKLNREIQKDGARFQMAISTRKLVGTFLLLIFLVLYAFVMFVVGTALAVNTTSQLAAFAFYALAGFGWVVPAGWILMWILKPLREENSSKNPKT